MTTSSPKIVIPPVEAVAGKQDSATEGSNGASFAGLGDRINDDLRKLDPDSDAFKDYLNALSKDSLRCFNYDLFYFNLLSIFADTLTPEEIEPIASDCTKLRMWKSWENYCRIHKLMSQDSSLWKPKLEGWDIEGLRSLLDRGKGLVVCTPHFGSYRDVPFDLAMMGFRVCVALDSGMARFYKNFLEQCKDIYREAKHESTPDFIDRMSVADVEGDTLATMSVMNALRRNEIVIFFVDGNSGLDGRWGNKNRFTFEFLNRLISVRAGAAYISAAVQAPMLMLLTLSDPDSPSKIAYWDEAVFQKTDESEARHKIGNDCIRSLYKAMEPLVISHPQQWESCCFFHRWRVPDQPLRPGIDAQREAASEVTGLLDAGASFQLNRKRAAVIWTPNKGDMLVDVDTLITYAFTSDSQTLIKALSEGTSIDRQWVYSHQSIDGLDKLTPKVIAKIQHLCTVDLLKEKTAETTNTKGGD